jgi:hypothetical protein
MMFGDDIEIPFFPGLFFGWVVMPDATYVLSFYVFISFR